MRILSIVTLVSPDGAYGGPLRVAVNQARALVERGHEVTILGGHRGYDGPPPTEIDGVPAKLFPARRLVPRTGFAGLCAPGTLRHLHRYVRSYDIVHVHAARDLVTLPAARLAAARGVPYVLQTHGMIDPSTRLLARGLDPVATLPVLRAARTIFYLTSTERDALQELGGARLRLRLLPNGVPTTDLTADPATPEVLYLARLAPRKRPQVMVDVADALLDEFPRHRFRLVGPDEGEAGPLQQRMSSSRADITWEGALAPESTLERMSRAGLYVLPSVHEPYCMTVLEAMSVGLPVVITEQNGLAKVVRRSGAGIITGTAAADITAAVRQLLSDPGAARQMGMAAQRAAREELGMAGIAKELELVYEESVHQASSA